MGREFLDIKDPDDVKRIIANIPIKKRVEKVSIENSLTRILSEDINATINLPPFRRVQMDGYAVIAEDTFNASEENPVRLKLLEVVGAGDVPAKKLTNGFCTEVSTGAPVPEDANGVVMVEFTDTKDGEILIYESAAIGQNIAKVGSDIKVGELLLKSFTQITPDKIGVLSAIGLREVPVFKKPRVAIISTGNEIISNDEELTYGKIYDINSQTISSAVKSCGCLPLHTEIVKDDYNSLKDKINEFKDVDLFITSGSTSAGTGDILRDVLDDIGEVIVHGVSVKPGKPTIIGRLRKGKFLFGLPGNPAAAIMVFHIFFAPFLRKMASIDMLVDQNKGVVELVLSRRYRPARGRTHYLLVKIDGKNAIPILKDSGAITALAEADGFIEISKNAEILEKGINVKVFPLSGLINPI
ncbi:MAG: gephyrin-like molybdotransferase Glp [Methanobacterium sp.]|uniref:molybdenum cofactor synthesis domain-containing protein n=1 Tax=Methanobacterium sp. TaxID=2164 RepID=UPI003C779A30